MLFEIITSFGTFFKANTEWVGKWNTWYTIPNFPYPKFFTTKKSRIFIPGIKAGDELFFCDGILFCWGFGEIGVICGIGGILKAMILSVSDF